MSFQESESESRQAALDKALSQLRSLQEEVQLLSEEKLKHVEEMLDMEKQHDGLKKTLACMSDDHQATVAALEENCASLQGKVSEMEKQHASALEEVRSSVSSQVSSEAHQEKMQLVSF